MLRFLGANIDPERWLSPLALCRDVQIAAPHLVASGIVARHRIRRSAPSVGDGAGVRCAELTAGQLGPRSPSQTLHWLIGSSLAVDRVGDVKKQTIPLAVGALAAVAWATASRAASAVAEPAESPAVRQQISYARPNGPLLEKGIFAFFASYVPSVIVAVVNDNSYDKRLYVPVVGPWLDLADRPGCGGTGQSPCGTEAAYKVLLVVVGALQGLGAAATVVGLAVPERIITPAPAMAGKLTLHVLPAQMGRDGYGMQALGTF
jgi:hypothetical protein